MVSNAGGCVHLICRELRTMGTQIRLKPYFCARFCQMWQELWMSFTNCLPNYRLTFPVLSATLYYRVSTPTPRVLKTNRGETYGTVNPKRTDTIGCDWELHPLRRAYRFESSANSGEPFGVLSDYPKWACWLGVKRISFATSHISRPSANESRLQILCR